MGIDPARRGQFEEVPPIESVRRPEVDILHARGQAESRSPKVALQAAVLTIGGLAVDEHAEAVLKAETAIGGGLLTLLGECVGHASEVEGVELVSCRCAEHGSSLLVHS
jgi:hypothetical protein